MHSTDLSPSPQGPLDALSDEELYTALDAVVLYHDAKQQEPPPVVPGEIEESPLPFDAAPPEAHTVDWQILHSEALLVKLYRELCRRDPYRFKMPVDLILPQRESERALNRRRACPRLLLRFLRCSYEGP